MEIAIAAVTLAPTAHVVSKMWLMIAATFTLRRFALQTLDFEFLSFFSITASLICCPANRKIVRRTIGMSTTVGFEPTPTPEGEW